jgi:hypothetical protein
MANGFAPSWYEGQLNAGLGVWIATGLINGIEVNGQVITVPANSTIYIWVTDDGTVSSGASLPGGVYGIAEVVSGQVIVGGNLPAGLTGPLGLWAGLSKTDGILSITDIRS